jgi:hypothetical protein
LLLCWTTKQSVKQLTHPSRFLLYSANTTRSREMTFQPHWLEFTVEMVLAMALTILVVMTGAMIFRPELLPLY